MKYRLRFTEKLQGMLPKVGAGVEMAPNTRMVYRSPMFKVGNVESCDVS
jgi:hypothetical protein